jgi:hypothetical protein
LRDASLKVRVLLGALVAVLVLIAGRSVVHAQEAGVHIDPASQVVPQVGEIFSINVSIADVTDLFGYDFMLWYNTTLLDCVDVVWPSHHFLTPVTYPSNIFKVKTIEDNFNDTHGAVRVVTTLTGSEPPKNGSGVLVTITFNSTTTDGPSPLILYWPGYVYPVKLSDPDGTPISCTATDGEVTVIPEFPSTFMLISLILITATITLFKKGRTSPRKP